MEEQVIFKTAAWGFNRQEVLVHINKLQQHAKTLQTAADERVKVEAERAIALEQEKAELQSRLGEKSERVSEVEAALYDLKKQFDTSKEQIEERDRRCAMLNEQADTFRKRIDTLTDKLRETEGTRKEPTSLTASLESEIAELLAINERLEDEKHLLEARVAELTQKARQYDDASTSIAQAIVEAQRSAMGILDKANREAAEVRRKAAETAGELAENFTDFRYDIEEFSLKIRSALQGAERRLTTIDRATDEAVARVKALHHMQTDETAPEVAPILEKQKERVSQGGDTGESFL